MADVMAASSNVVPRKLSPLPPSHPTRSTLCPLGPSSEIFKSPVHVWSTSIVTLTSMTTPETSATEIDELT